VVAIEVGLGAVSGLEAGIEAGISAVGAVRLRDHSTRTFAVVSRVAAVAREDGVEGGGGPECSSHSALQDWHQEMCDGVAVEPLPQAAPCRSSFGNAGG